MSNWQQLAKDARTSKADQNRIRRSAMLQDCTIMLPGVCCHDPETVVLAHAPCVDKGLGFKSPDEWAAYACHTCHEMLDGRAPGLLADDAAPYWLRGIFRTQRILKEMGLLRVGK